MTKWVKDNGYWERLVKLGLTTLRERRMSGDLIETSEIINGISNYGRHFFNISSRNGNLLSREISKIKSSMHLDFLFFFFLLIE